MSNVCNNDLRLSPPVEEAGVIRWVDCSLPQGSLDEFWSPDPLDSPVAFIGALELVGEVLNNGEVNEIFTVRKEANAAVCLTHQWVSMFFFFKLG